MIIQNSIFHVNFTIMQYYLLSLQSLLSTWHKFHWPYWDMHSSSGLVSRNSFRQISATWRRFSFQHFFQPLSCSYVHCVSCSSLQQSKGTQYTALDQIVRYSFDQSLSTEVRKIQQRCPLVPSGYATVCFRVLLLFVGNLTLQSNQKFYCKTIFC